MDTPPRLNSQATDRALNNQEIDISSVAIHNKFSNFFKREFHLPWRWVEWIEILIYIIVSWIICAMIGSTMNHSNVEDDQKRSPLAVFSIIACPLSAIYGVIFMKLRLTPFRVLVIFLIICVAPVIWIIVNVSQEDFSYLPLVFLAYFPGLFIFFGVLRFAKESIYNNGKIFLSSLIPSLICILAPLIMGASAIFLVLEKDDVDTDLGRIFLKIMAFPYLLLLILIWTVIHLELFKKYPNQFEVYKEMIKNGDYSDLAVQVLFKKNPDLLNQEPSKWNIFHENIHWISSITLLGCLLAMEIGIINLLDKYLKGDADSDALWMCCFYLPVVPAFLFTGITFSASRLKKNDKFSSGTLVGGIPITMAVMVISYYLYDNDSTYYLGILVGLGFPISTIYWFLLAMVFHHNKRAFQLILPISFLIGVIPLGYLWPLYSISVMKTSTFWVLTGIVGIGGLLILIFDWLIDFVIKFKTEMLVIFNAAKLINTFDLIQLSYTICFIIGFAILVWTACKETISSSDSPRTSGYLIGCFSILGFMIILTIIVHRVSFYNSDAYEHEWTISEIVLKRKTEITPLQSKLLQKKRKYMKITLGLGVTIPFVIAIPLLAVTKEQTTTTGVAVIIGFLFSTFFILILMELKHYLRKYGKAIISYILGWCWCFFYLPLVCFIPISVSMVNSKSELQQVTSWSLGIVSLLFMSGVGMGSIAINTIFKSVEREKIAKHCCLILKHRLMKSGVRSKMQLLRAIYEQIYYSDPESVKKVLLDMTAIYYFPVDENDPDLRFSKDLVTISDLMKLQNKNKIQVIDNVDKDEILHKDEISCWQWLKNIFATQDEKLIVKEEIDVLEDDMNFTTEESAIEPSNNNYVKMQPNSEEGTGQESRQSSNEWTHAFKKQVKHVQEKKRQEMQNALFRIAIMDPDEPKADNEEIKENKLTEAEIMKIKRNEHFQVLKENPDVKKEWFNMVFFRFSHGLIVDDNGPWMTSHDMRQFLRLSGLKYYFPNVSCDILYVKLTRKFNAARSHKTFTKIRFNEFYDTLLDIIGRSMYPHLSPKEAFDKIFEEKIYPNLVSNLPYLGSKLKLDIKGHEERLRHTVGTLIMKKIDFTAQAPVASVVVNPYLNMFKLDAPKNSMEIPDNETAEPKIEEIQPHSSGGVITSTINLTKRRSVFIESEAPEIDKMQETQKKKKGACAKLNNCLECFFNTISSISDCIVRLAAVLFKGCFACLSPKSAEEDKLIKVSSEPQSEEDSLELIVRRDSPDWPEICEIVTETLSSALEDAKKIMEQKKSTDMQMNLSNLTAIVSMVTEIYSFSSMAFSSQVNWLGNNSENEVSNNVSGQSEYWEETFWACLIAAFVFIAMVWPAVKYLKEGKLGLNKDHTKAKFPSWQFILLKSISLLGCSLYLTIMSNILAAFSCQFDDSSNYWYLSKDDSIECFGTLHSVYIALAVVCAILYYPLATLLYPNIQYQNKELDLKYDTTFLVLESQGKLLIAGFSAFFLKSKYLWLQLTVVIVVCSILMVINIITKPCFVRSFNIWKAAGYFVAIWSCSWALVSMQTDQQVLAFSFLIAGYGVILGVMIYLQSSLYGCAGFKKLKHIKSVLRGREVYDENDGIINATNNQGEPQLFSKVTV
ncbi:unnamed protein product [Blepharisma stoltei]|uniref:Uncharacterized protein n=1 Tax=Blepharisma stoltei TaxID=1481888 RepID=A0AAU9J8W9_9CILI|nr:unnamed protein product [Blepharisma stoltei]